MAKRKTHGDFVKEVYNLVADEYSVLGGYVNTKTKLLMRHNLCNSEYLVEPRQFLRGNRCPPCCFKTRGASPKTQEKFEEEVYDLVGDEYTVVGEYTGAMEKVELFHSPCSSIWKVTPNAFFAKGSRCLKCARAAIGVKNRKTHQDFVQEIVEVFGADLQVLGEYTLSNSKVQVKHIDCGHEWSATAHHLLEGQGCPNCKSSKGEKLTKQFLVNMEIPFEGQKTFDDLKDSSYLSYDFFLPRYNTLIEYQGIQHYEPVSFFGATDPEERFLYQQKHDAMKREYAQDNGYKLIEIPYTENTYKRISNYLEKELEFMV